MGTAYFDARSVAIRLDQTICMYKGQPVLVEIRPVRDGNWHNVYISPLPIGSEASKVVDYREPEFNYKAFPLGYINLSEGSAHYLMRIPNRQQKQGLDRSCVMSTPEIPRLWPWFHSEAFKDCILGNHPSHENAVASVESYERTSCAFSRNFAVGKEHGLMSLHYKGRLIGYRDRDRYKLLPAKNVSVLRSILSEELTAILGDQCLV